MSIADTHNLIVGQTEYELHPVGTTQRIAELEADVVERGNVIADGPASAQRETWIVGLARLALQLGLDGEQHARIRTFILDTVVATSPPAAETTVTDAMVWALRPADLTPRQCSVAALRAKHYTTKQIAAELEMTQRCVLAHEEAIAFQAGFDPALNTQSQIACWWREHVPIHVEPPVPVASPFRYADPELLVSGLE